MRPFEGVRSDKQRARWGRALRVEALDTVDRDDLALGGLASRLANPSARVLVLPSDPEADVLPIDDELWAWFENFQTVNVAGRNVSFGLQTVPTAHAAARVDSYGSREAWRSYVAIHRSGAIEHGLGDRGGWERTDPNGNPVRMFNLIAIVVRTWALLTLASSFYERIATAGPHQLTVALHRTSGAYLGNVGEGWAEPRTFENDLPPCAESHLMWHFELEEWPVGEQVRDLAFAVGNRLEDAWGSRHRRYLACTGDYRGKLDVRGLRE